jgi:hypothetical protein
LHHPCDFFNSQALNGASSLFLCLSSLFNILNLSFHNSLRPLSGPRRPKNIDQFLYIDIPPIIRIRRGPKVPNWLWLLVFPLASLVLFVALLPTFKNSMLDNRPNSIILDTCHMSQKPFIMPQPIPGQDLVCFSDYSDNFTLLRSLQFRSCWMWKAVCYLMSLITAMNLLLTRGLDASQCYGI